MIRVTPFNFQFDNIQGDLFIDLYKFILATEAGNGELLKILNSVQKRLSHASLKLPFVEGRPSVDQALSAVMKIEKLVSEKVNLEFGNKSEPSLQDFINDKFGISNFEYFFEDLQRKRFDATALNFRKDLVGQKTQDGGIDYLARAKNIRYPVLQLVAFSSADFDLAHQLRLIGNILNSDSKKQSVLENAHKMLGWVEAQHNYIGVQELGTPLSRLNNPLSDSVWKIKELTALEVEKVKRFPQHWPEKRFSKAYLESGSNIETLYFNWSVSVLRDLIVWTGISKSEANENVEAIYRNLGIDLSWSRRMGNTGGIKKPSLPDPLEIFFQLRSLIAFFDSANVL